MLWFGAKCRDLVDQLSGTADPVSQAIVLTSLGNAGDTRTLDTIRAYQSSEDPRVRAGVAQAVRRISDPGADQVLAHLYRDPDESVRYSALDAIGERSSSPALVAAVST